MTMPIDNNISVKVHNKISIYKDLEKEKGEMWHLKTTSNARNCRSSGYDQEKEKQLL